MGALVSCDQYKVCANPVNSDITLPMNALLFAASNSSGKVDMLDILLGIIFVLVVIRIWRLL